MANLQSPFEDILVNFKKHLTTKELEDFEFVTLKDVQLAVLGIQRDQENLKTMMNMTRVQSFLEAMTQFGKVVEVFANAHIFVCAVWGPMKFILQNASTWANSFDTILDAYRQIGEHMPHLTQYESLFGSKPEMVRVLAFLYQDILDFHLKAVRMFRGKTEVWRHLFRSIWKDFETKFKGLLDGLKSHRQLIVEQAALLHYEEAQKKIQATHDRVEHYGQAAQLHYEESQRSSQKLFSHIQQYQKDRFERLERLAREENENEGRKYREILDWFCAAQSTTADHEKFCTTRKFYAGSSTWILKHDKFHNWKETSIPVNSMLWVSGIPGAGKTILASSIIESCLLDNSRTTAYFYCREEDPEKNTSISIFRSLLSQLLNHCRELIPYCYEKYQMSGELNLTSSVLAEQLLKLSFELIQKSTIVIDGLDECTSDQRKSIMTFFTMMVNKCDEKDAGKLRVLFISQDFPDIAKGLQTAENLRITSKDNERDIEAYINHWSKIISDKNSLDETQMNFISESTFLRSHGMFLYAKLVMENLLAQETRTNLLTEIQSYQFPEGLGEAYERILGRLERSKKAKQWEIVRKLLGWMVCAKRPLKWREIQAAFSIDPDAQEIDFDGRRLRSSIEEYCGSLIQILSEDRVELVHTTAKIHINNSKHIRPLVVECNIASLCLRYLTFECFDNEISQDSLSSLVSDGYLAFQDYAAAKWLQHIRAIILNSSNQPIHDHESQAALQELGMSLEEFCARYQEDLTGCALAKDIQNDCEAFNGCNYHKDLLYVWNHVYLYDMQNQEIKKELSLPTLNKSVLRNRKVLESLLPPSHDIITFYGDKLFKCPRPTCFYFHQGFKGLKSRTLHINKHDRPFNCVFPDCSIAEFGFSSNKDLEKHRKTFHPEHEDLLNTFAGKPKATAATPWACELCGKRFTRGFHQRNHMRSHAGERQYKCSECGKAFVRNNDCKRHEKIHARR